MSRTNQRSHYRIPYPIRERPRLVFGSNICEVVDCSERGVRFAIGSAPEFHAGVEIEGRIRFQRGEEVRIRGVVVRTEVRRVALELHDTGIPFGVILQEQLYLRRALRQRAGEPASSHG